MRHKKLMVLLMVIVSVVAVIYGCSKGKESKEETGQPPNQEDTIPDNGNDKQEPDDNIPDDEEKNPNDNKPGEPEQPQPSEEKVKITFVNGDNRKEEIVAKGESVEQPQKPQKDGWSFLGWFDIQGVEYVFGNPIESDLEIYAQWAPIITFETGFGSKVENIIATKGFKIPEEPKYVKHRFAGWYENTECDGIEYVLDSQQPPAKPITLYAKWIEQVTITFVDGYKSITLDKGTQATPPSDTDLSDNFSGWYDEDENLFDFSTPVTKDVILHAKYEEIKWYAGEWRGWHIDYFYNIFEYYLVINDNGNIEHDKSYYYYLFDGIPNKVGITEEYEFNIDNKNKTFTIMGEINDKVSVAEFEYSNQKLYITKDFQSESS